MHPPASRVLALALVGAAVAAPTHHPRYVLDARLERAEATGTSRTNFGTEPCTILAEKGCSQLTQQDRMKGGRTAKRRCHDFFEHNERLGKDIVCRKTRTGDNCRNNVGFFTTVRPPPRDYFARRSQPCIPCPTDDGRQTSSRPCT